MVTCNANRKYPTVPLYITDGAPPAAPATGDIPNGEVVRRLWTQGDAWARVSIRELEGWVKLKHLVPLHGGETWECNRCTLRNTGKSKRCDACALLRCDAALGEAQPPRSPRRSLPPPAPAPPAPAPPAPAPPAPAPPASPKAPAPTGAASSPATGGSATACSEQRELGAVALAAVAAKVWAEVELRRWERAVPARVWQGLGQCAGPAWWLDFVTRGELVWDTAVDEWGRDLISWEDNADCLKEAAELLSDRLLPYERGVLLKPPTYREDRVIHKAIRACAAVSRVAQLWPLGKCAAQVQRVGLAAWRIKHGLRLGPAALGLLVLNERVVEAMVHFGACLCESELLGQEVSALQAPLAVAEVLMAVYYLLAYRRGERGDNPLLGEREHSAGAAGVVRGAPDPEDLRTLRHYAPLVACTYESDWADMTRLLVLGGYQVIKPHAAVPGRHPAFHLVCNSGKKQALLLIRGTVSLGDVLVDAAATSQRVLVNGQEYYVHRGMLRAALWINQTVGPALRALHDSKHQVTVAGHSLGAGAAVLLTAMLREHFAARAVVFACPAIADYAFSVWSRQWCLSCFLGDDMVPRARVSAFRELGKIAADPDFKDLIRGQLQQEVSGAFWHLGTIWAPMRRRDAPGYAWRICEETDRPVLVLEHSDETACNSDTPRRCSGEGAAAASPGAGAEGDPEAVGVLFLADPALGLASDQPSADLAGKADGGACWSKFRADTRASEVLKLAESLSCLPEFSGIADDGMASARRRASGGGRTAAAAPRTQLRLWALQRQPGSAARQPWGLPLDDPTLKLRDVFPGQNAGVVLLRREVVHVDPVPSGAAVRMGPAEPTLLLLHLGRERHMSMVLDRSAPLLFAAEAAAAALGCAGLDSIDLWELWGGDQRRLHRAQWEASVGGNGLRSGALLKAVLQSAAAGGCASESLPDLLARRRRLEQELRQLRSERGSWWRWPFGGRAMEEKIKLIEGQLASLPALPSPELYTAGRTVHLWRDRGTVRGSEMWPDAPLLARIEYSGDMLEDHRMASIVRALGWAEQSPELRTKLPRWEAYGERDRCACCSNPFGWSSPAASEVDDLRGRENCCSCGKVVCAECCETRKTLPDKGIFAEVSVCARCAMNIHPH
eukprot:TRINITY_DN4804_c0_g2_i1.p1 TRINITY_DN4804_c0_g2~~TRINITY_DN4804_c0_g2_i1.p1  ORF type:complete len:1169 (+),score=299.23 TRINITY_DN4804_c0_g2_i1:124-3507(+)